MKFEEPRLFGINEEGFYLGKIKRVGIIFSFNGRHFERLHISNRKNLFKGYRNIGLFLIEKPHDFRKNDLIIVKINQDGKLIEIKHDIKNKHEDEVSE